ncbi:hypothetical protein DWV12_16400 [Clostridium botulinum]|uniref:hypothetical protein n=1 Tax=Clostridium botulinum TaxID=1491 RepID=UPI00217D49CA|nr:hypothetical protein [Clostridium botulinum]MCS6108897.1 hypothetical protein [Clostridium botulinum]
MTTYSPFELEPIFIDFKNESYNLGLDIQANQNDTLTLNFICRNNGIEEDMSKYKVELRVHNNNSNTDYIQTQNENVTLGADGSVKIVCQSLKGNKLTAYSGQCNGVLRIFNTENKQKATRIITMRIVADPLETGKANICESTITKLEDLDWILNEAYNIEDEFKKAIEEAIKQKAELVAKISESVTAKNNLNSTIQTANNTNNTLTDTNNNAVNTKNELNTLNNNAINTKSNLDKSNSGALVTNKTLSDTNTTAINTNNTLNTTINNANNSKTALDTSKNNADKSKSALDGSVSTGNTLKTNLDGSIATGTTLKNDIDNRITTGNKLKTDLDNSSTVATSKKEILDTANVQAEKNIETLNSFGDASQLTKDVTTLKTKVLENTLTSIETDSTLTKLDNCENGFVRNMQIKGKTLQNLVSSVNTAVWDDSQKRVQRNIKDNICKDNTSYSFINVSSKKIFVDLYLNNNVYSRSISLEPLGKQVITLNNEYILLVWGRASDGWANTDADKIMLNKSLMILEGEVKEILPYFEGIQSTGEAEGNKISILSCGKNLFSFDNFNSNNATYEIINSHELKMSVSNTFNGVWKRVDHLIIGNKYTFSLNVKSSKNCKLFFGAEKINTPTVDITNEYKQLSVTFTAVTKTQTLFIYNQTVLENSIYIKDIILTDGKITEGFDDYKSDKTEILLPSPHMGLPNGVSDVIDYEKNERIKNIGKALFVGSDSENWSMRTDTNANKDSIMFINPLNVNSGDSVICNRFINNNNLWNEETEGIQSTISQRDIRIRISKSKLETQDVAGFKKWLQANPTTVYYQLANPITEKLNIKDTLQSFENGYIMLDNAITPTAQLEYSTNIPSALGGLTKVVDKLVDDVTNVEITISDMDAEIGEARKDKNTLNERLEDDKKEIDLQLKEKANLKDVKIFSNLADIGLSANDMTTDFSNNVLKIIKAIGANRRISLYPYQTESNTNLYNSIKTWCGFNTDAYQLYIDTSFNGAENLPNKIEVIPNYNNGNNKYFIGFFDNQLGICREIQFVDDTGWIDISSALNGKVKGHARIRRIWNQVFFELDFSGELINENETILVIPKEYAPRRRDEFPFCRFTAGVMTIGIKRDATVFMDYVNTGTYNTRSYVSCQASYLID